MSDSKKRVLSGMRPTGKLHLGNYMGALYNWVRLQREYECYFFIADWHALTTDYADTSQVKKNTLDVALDFLAAGLDPEECTIFVQSHVPQHAELHLYFSMMTPLGWLERVPTYKEQLENIKGKDLTTYGFLGYPVLQSAYFLIYQAHFVPVGQDQVTHVELTREVARRFNSMYKTEVFPEPEALLTPTPKLPGIDGRKMSKSYNNTIGLTDPPAIVASKVHNMSTNGQRIRQSDPGDPDLCPVGDLHKIFSSEEVIAETQKGCRTATIRCEFCKIDAGRSVAAVTEPIYARRQQYESQIDETWDLLLAGGRKAQARSEETMAQVRAAMNISHDLGALRRHFVHSEESRNALRDLSRHSDWWTLPSDQRSKLLRDYWRNNLVPYDISLSQESNRIFPTIEKELEEPFITNRKKRVGPLLLAEGEYPDGWHFRLPTKSYEVWVLLCWEKKKYLLHDLILPQKVYSQAFAQAKAMVKQGDTIHVIVRQRLEKWSLHFPNLQLGQPVGDAIVVQSDDGLDVTEFLHNYQPLQ